METAKSYEDIKSEYGDNYIPYHILLSSIEWKQKRLIIIERDLCQCQKCGSCDISERNQMNIAPIKSVLTEGELLEISIKLTSLHVHHKHYIEGLLPWEYQDEDLITYCCECHRKWHEENEVEYFVYSNGEYCKKHYTVCGRCSGAGWFPEYIHRDGGICYECLGQRYKELFI